MAVAAAINVLMTANASQLEREAKKGKSAIDNLKKSLGGRSGLKDTLEILRGGGAVVGLALAGRALQDMAATMKEINDETGEIKRSWSDVVHDFLDLVPLYSIIAKGGRDIRNEITGERKEVERLLKVEELRKAVLDDVAKVLKDSERNRESMEAQAEIAGLSGTIKDLAENLRKAEEEKRKLLDDFEDRYKKIQESVKASVGTIFESSQRAFAESVTKQLEADVKRNMEAIDRLTAARADEIRREAKKKDLSGNLFPDLTDPGNIPELVARQRTIVELGAGNTGPLDKILSEIKIIQRKLNPIN